MVRHGGAANSQTPCNYHGVIFCTPLCVFVNGIICTMTKPNWKNQTIWTGDCLDIMRGMNTESVDLIYLDPPFNSKANYAAPIGSKAAGAAFKDTWGLNDINLAWHGLIKADYPALYDLLVAVRSVHGDSMMSYLIYMAVRIMEMRRLLTLSGCLYLHCDPTASHYLKLVMDSIFGAKRFRSEISWKRFNFHADAKRFGALTDTILLYARGDSHTFNTIRVPYSKEYIKSKFKKDPESQRLFALDNLNPPGGRGPVYEFCGVTKAWRFTEEKMLQLLQEGRIYTASRVPRLKRFLDEMPGQAVGNIWLDIPPVNSQAKERVGYPIQKPLALLRRIIEASSNENDMVLDPFCGCATACIAAETHQRQWAGIDISPKAADLVKSRMQDELGLFYNGIHRTDVPKRTDLGEVPKYNLVAEQEKPLWRTRWFLSRLQNTLYDATPYSGSHHPGIKRGDGSHQQFAVAMPRLQFEERHRYTGRTIGATAKQRIPQSVS